MEPIEYDLMDAVEESMWWYRALHRRVLRALRSAWPRALPLLDAGCGTGGFLKILNEVEPAIEAEALEAYAPAAARARAKANVPVEVGSVNSLPFADGRFGAVVSLDVLCHRSVDLDVALSEMRRVLAPGGLLVLNLPALDWLQSAHDRRVHTSRRFERKKTAAVLAACGFTDVRARYWNTLLLPLMVAQRKILSRNSDHSDVDHFHPAVDRSLFAVTQIELGLSRIGVPMPAGGSLLVTARR